MPGVIRYRVFGLAIALINKHKLVGDSEACIKANLVVFQQNFPKNFDKILNSLKNYYYEIVGNKKIKQNDKLYSTEC